MKRIILIPSGREDRMSILMIYINRLIVENLVDEVHLWMFPRNESDFNWIKTLETEKIIIMYPTVNNDSIQKDKTEWEYNKHYDARQDEMFAHYSDEKYAECFFIKMDDDIVWIDFQEVFNLWAFCEGNDNFSVITPIVVNNPNLKNLIFTEHYPEKAGLISSCVENGIEFLTYDKQLVESPYYGNDTHFRFLVDPDRFKKVFAISNPAQLEGPNENLKYLDSRYFCINFICFKHNVFKEIKKYMVENKAQFNDEFFISTQLPSITKKPNILLNRVGASHLSYNQQDSGMFIESLLYMYKIKAEPIKVR